MRNAQKSIRYIRYIYRAASTVPIVPSHVRILSEFPCCTHQNTGAAQDTVKGAGRLWKATIVMLLKVETILY